MQTLRQSVAMLNSLVQMKIHKLAADEVRVAVRYIAYDGSCVHRVALCQQLLPDSFHPPSCCSRSRAWCLFTNPLHTIFLGYGIPVHY